MRTSMDSQSITTNQRQSEHFDPPNSWKFIDILKREQNLAQVHIAQARAGHQPEP